MFERSLNMTYFRTKAKKFHKTTFKHLIEQIRNTEVLYIFIKSKQ